KQLADGRAEAARLRAEAQEEGAQIIADMKAQAHTEADRIIESAQTQINAERQSAMVQLRSEVGTLATDLASRIVGESLTDDERSANVVDRFIADLESDSSAQPVKGARCSSRADCPCRPSPKSRIPTSRGETHARSVATRPPGRVCPSRPPHCAT